MLLLLYNLQFPWYLSCPHQLSGPRMWGFEGFLQHNSFIYVNLEEEESIHTNIIGVEISYVKVI